MTIRPWKVKHRKILLTHSRVLVTEETVCLPDGQLVDDYLQIVLKEHVAIIVRSADGRFLLQRQYKHGPRAVNLTFPAGEIAVGERPLQAARRELREETGIRGGVWRSLGRFVLNGNQGAGAAHIFAVEDIKIAKRFPGSFGDLEEQEIRWVNRDQLAVAVRRGHFKIITHALAAAFALNPKIMGGTVL